MAGPIVLFRKMDLLRRIVNVPRCRRVVGAVAGAGASAVAGANAGLVLVAVVDV